MAVAGALIGKAIGAFGRKPKIPELPTIDPNAIQRDTVQSNISNLPDLERLGSRVNQFNQNQQLSMLQKALEFALPGGLGKVQDITNAQLRGEVPADVSRRVQEFSAANALRGGFAGSGLSRNLVARDLGLTSLGIQQQGLGNFQALAGLVPQTPLFDVTSMFFSPQQRLEFAFRDRESNFQRNLLAEQVAAAPDPATAALGREIDRFFNTAAQVGMMYAGQAGGGGGGMGGGGASGAF